MTEPRPAPTSAPDDALPTPGSRPGRVRRLTSRTLGLLGRGARRAVAPLVVLALLWAGGAWYFAGQIHEDALGVSARTEAEPRVPVAAVRPGRVALALREGSPGMLTRLGTWGLRWDDGYGQVTRILHADESRVVRRLRVLVGMAPRVGDRVAIGKDSFGDDPGEVLGLRYREVRYRSPLGHFPAWLLPGRRDTWAVLVHGRDAPRSEMLRMARTTHAAGMPTLVPTYRDDPEAAPDPSGLHQFGETEWRDLEGAVRYARRHGAHDVVLVGSSMGGAIVTEFCDSSDLARTVDGVVLDGPLLDLQAAIDDSATRRTLPFTPVPLPPGLDETASWVAELRDGIDMGDFDHTDEAVALDVPVLVFHGPGDLTAPVAVSDEVVAERRAAGRPTTYVRVRGASHVAEWNADPRRYDRALAGFLRRATR